MALLISVSGIRGTIGGAPGDNLTPADIVRFTSAYASWLLTHQASRRVVVGRDGRISGPLVQSLVVHTLMAMGMDVIDLGLTTTPTVEVAVPIEKAAGGIIITASHNPREWNALKLLNHRGEFLSAEDGNEVMKAAGQERITYAPVDHLGRHFLAGDYLDEHLRRILDLPLVHTEAVRHRKFHIAVDGINSSGAIAVPRLLEALGATCTVIHHEVTGQFAHNPEPLPEHLTTLTDRVRSGDFDLGIAVDPDVDRLALVCGDGTWFGEEYTLVAAADHWLAHHPGPVVHNLSSSRALKDLAGRYGQECRSSAVGEAHVVRMMRETHAVIGGEGNGGVIVPDLHYGRDALVGIALILSLLVERNTSLAELRRTYPSYAMSKQKVILDDRVPWTELIDHMTNRYPEASVNRTDGLKIDLQAGWIHLRKSNTEPIVRVYAEAGTPEEADRLAREAIEAIVAFGNTLSPAR